MSYVLGIDLGTSSLKGILMNQEGKVVCEKSSEYSLDIPKAGYSEQKPEYWIVACEEVLTGLSNDVKDFGDQLQGISFSGQMHSLVTLDESNKSIYPAILWNDVRTTEQCKEIMSTFGTELLEITKNVALEGFTLPKILWLQQNKPDVWEKTAKIMLPKDYLSFWFTGKICSEYSDAAGTLLLDIEKRSWSEEICDHFEIDMEILPDLVDSMTTIGSVRSDIRERYKLKQDVKVLAGGADNACAALGTGLVDEELGLVSIGTSGVFSAYEPEIRDYQVKLHFFNHVIPNVFYSMGVTLAAGNSLSWFKETFGKGLSFETLLKDISTVHPGSNGLLFTPYIVGERTPYFDSDIRGSFIGIDIHHELKHFSRSVLEGITFSLKDSQKMMEQVKNQKFTRLLSVGGGAKNSDWMQIQADIFDAEIIGLSIEQGPGAGACMIAAIGSGWFNDIQTAAEVFIKYKKKSFKPIPKNVKQYQKIYQIWTKVYGATRDICHELKDLEN